MSRSFKYARRCIAEMEGCNHVVQVGDGPSQVWPGSALYTHLKSLGRPIPAHLEHYRETCDVDALPALPDEDGCL